MLLRAVATVGGYTMASRVLGFVRDLLIASFLGAGPVADAFFVALRLPNLFRRLFAEGAFNAAFIPVFAGVLADGGKATATLFAERVLTLMLLVLTVLTIAAEVFMPSLVWGLAPGLAEKPGSFALATDMARLTFPYLWLITLASLMGAILNALGKFAAAAAAPCLLNLIMIGALLLAADALETPGHVLSVAVALAGLAQLAMMAWALKRSGYELRLVLPRFDKPVVRVLKLLGPGAIGAGVMQINLLVGTLIASLLPTGAIAYLYYADRIYQLPLGVIGVAMGTALLPRLAGAIKGGEIATATSAMNRAIELALFLTLPAAVALAVIPEAVVSTLFQRGAFGAEDALATANVLVAYAVGLPAFVLVKVLSPGFFAREDTTTPVRIAGVAVAANVVLGFALYRPLGAMGLALATTLASWINAGLLGLVLYRRGHFAPDLALMTRLPRAFLAALVMGAIVLFGSDQLDHMLAGAELLRAAALAIVCGAGAAAYFVLAWACGAADRAAVANLAKRPLDRLRRRRDKP
jgi:putative peptidoglycan lipid II flippase